MTLTPRDKHEIGKAHGKLVDRLTRKQDELDAMKYLTYSQPKFQFRLAEKRAEVASLLQRIERAERLMEGQST